MEDSKNLVTKIVIVALAALILGGTGVISILMGLLGSGFSALAGAPSAAGKLIMVYVGAGVVLLAIPTGLWWYWFRRPQ